MEGYDISLSNYFEIIQFHPAVNHKGRMLSVGELILNVHRKCTVQKTGTTKGTNFRF
jgi:hypothetical protein